jgi:hypothetical protein
LLNTALGVPTREKAEVSSSEYWFVKIKFCFGIRHERWLDPLRNTARRLVYFSSTSSLQRGQYLRCDCGHEVREHPGKHSRQKRFVGKGVQDPVRKRFRASADARLAVLQVTNARRCIAKPPP